MSKSIKRNNKYYGEDLYEARDAHEEHRQRLKEKRFRSALMSKNVNVLYELSDEY
jgi:hypothetical protein